MKIFYAIKPEYVEEIALEEELIVFVPDNYKSGFSNYWDDFGYKTTCAVYAWVRGRKRRVSLGEVKLLLKDTGNTHEKLKELCGDDKYVEFSQMGQAYVTLPESVDFYKKVEDLYPGKLPMYFSLAKDGGYLRIEGKSTMLNAGGFRSSLLREMGARKAFDYALAYYNLSGYPDIEFSIEYELDTFESPHRIDFDFTEGFYPANINLVIGPNGVGKTQGISKLMQELYSLDQEQISSIDAKPRLKPFFENIICCSFSPFENLAECINLKDVRSPHSFKYLGFYSDSEFDLKKPVRDSVNCLFDLVELAFEESDFEFDRQRVDALIDILGIGVPGLADVGVIVPDEYGGSYYATVNDDYEQFLGQRHEVLSDSGVYLFNANGGEPIPLSSGQKMFVNLVLGALAYIRKDTLLIIDEPELYLHPSLEIVLVRMLRELLEHFDSYAVISSHSLVVAREVPQRCTTVMKRVGDEPLIERPPFETFGASMDRINAYVFDDGKGVKKYQELLDEKHNKYGSLEAVMEQSDSNLNEESILYLMSRSK